MSRREPNHNWEPQEDDIIIQLLAIDKKPAEIQKDNRLAHIAASKIKSRIGTIKTKRYGDVEEARRNNLDRTSSRASYSNQPLNSAITSNVVQQLRQNLADHPSKYQCNSYQPPSASYSSPLQQSTSSGTNKRAIVEEDYDEDEDDEDIKEEEEDEDQKKNVKKIKVESPSTTKTSSLSSSPTTQRGILHSIVEIPAYKRTSLLLVRTPGVEWNVEVALDGLSLLVSALHDFTPSDKDPHDESVEIARMLEIPSQLISYSTSKPCKFEVVVKLEHKINPGATVKKTTRSLILSYVMITDTKAFDHTTSLR